MAELRKAISEFSETTTLPIGSLFLVSLESEIGETGYESYFINSENIGNVINNQYTFLSLETNAKTIVAAVNEINTKKQDAFTEVSGTLEAGETTITLSDETILETSTIDIYTTVFGVNPESVSVEEGSVVLTFAEMEDEIGVKVRVS